MNEEVYKASSRKLVPLSVAPLPLKPAIVTRQPSWHSYREFLVSELQDGHMLLRFAVAAALTTRAMPIEPPHP
jgi:hypothetical protein